MEESRSGREESTQNTKSIKIAMRRLKDILAAKKISKKVVKAGTTTAQANTNLQASGFNLTDEDLLDTSKSTEQQLAM